MEEELNFSKVKVSPNFPKMEDGLNFSKIEDNLNFSKMKDDFNCSKMEDDLNFFLNVRRPPLHPSLLIPHIPFLTLHPFNLTVEVGV